jgi:hypothetical protein
VCHHSAQNTIYTGLAASESVKLSPDARASVKSGATGPSGFETDGSGASVEVDESGEVEPDTCAFVVEEVWTSEAPESEEGLEHAPATRATIETSSVRRFM